MNESPALAVAIERLRELIDYTRSLEVALDGDDSGEGEALINANSFLVDDVDSSAISLPLLTSEDAAGEWRCPGEQSEHWLKTGPVLEDGVWWLECGHCGNDDGIDLTTGDVVENWKRGTA